MRILAPATLLCAAALAACSGSPTDAGTEIDGIAMAAQCSGPAPLLGTPDPRAAGMYIVVFRDGTNAPSVTARLAEKYGFQPRFVWEHALLGFAATLSGQAVAGIRCEPEVKYVEHDQVITIGG